MKNVCQQSTRFILPSSFISPFVAAHTYFSLWFIYYSISHPIHSHEHIFIRLIFLKRSFFIFFLSLCVSDFCFVVCLFVCCHLLSCFRADLLVPTIWLICSREEKIKLFPIQKYTNSTKTENPSTHTHTHARTCIHNFSIFFP